MPRKRKQDIRVNSNESLEGIMQEAYSDACLQIIDSQSGINQLTLSVTPDGVDDVTKIAKEKVNFLKVKDSAIRIKLEIAKLQSDIIKNRGDVDVTVRERSDSGSVLDGFKSIREMFKEPQNNTDFSEE